MNIFFPCLEFCHSESQAPLIPLAVLEGESVVFPVPVSKSEFAILRAKEDIIGMVMSGNVKILKTNFTNNVGLNISQEGYFTFHKVRIGDSGKYTIEKGETSKAKPYLFQLIVYGKLSTFRNTMTVILYNY